MAQGSNLFVDELNKKSPSTAELMRPDVLNQPSLISLQYQILTELESRPSCSFDRRRIFPRSPADREANHAPILFARIIRRGGFCRQSILRVSGSQRARLKGEKTSGIFVFCEHWIKFNVVGVRRLQCWQNHGKLSANPPESFT